MRSFFSDLLGNDRLRTALGEDVVARRLSHAYILEGAHGSGKHTLALLLAAALACEHRDDADAPLPCKSCRACRRILTGNSPDVIPIGRGDKATLGVEAIREMRSTVQVIPNDSDTKVYIIEDAHLMTEQAQNAFLLTLEEPPAHVLFLLLCENASRLLSTIRSRAQLLRTEPIPPERIRAYLTDRLPEARTLSKTAPADLSEIVAAADGSVGRAIALLDHARYAPIVAQRRLAKEFVALCRDTDRSAATLKMIGRLPQKRDELTVQCNVILWCLRDLLLCKQSDSAPLCFYADREEACTAAYDFTTPALLSLIDRVAEAIERLRSNANVRMTLVTLANDCGLLQ